MRIYVSTVISMAVPYNEDPSGWVQLTNDHTLDVEQEIFALRKKGYSIIRIIDAGCGDGGDAIYQNTCIEYKQGE